MSPIIDMQRSMTERGRIRLGYKTSGTRRDGSTYTRPAKSDTFLLSSHDRGLIDRAAAEMGTTAVEFDAGWRFDTGLKVLDVVIPPAYMAFSQWYELWGNKVCHRRCDGIRETISDGPCQCDPDPAKRECKTTTRLSVMLVDLPGFGLWRIESHGWYAATELFGGIEALTLLAPDTLVRGRLVADHREVVRFDADGKPKTHKFVVPTLDLPDVRLRELMTPDGGVGVAINAPVPNGLTPVPVAELAAGPMVSTAAQIAAVNAPAEVKPRSNAAQPLPSTGLRPGPKSPVASDRPTAPPATSPGGEKAAPSVALDPSGSPVDGGGSSATGQSQHDRALRDSGSTDTQHAPTVDDIETELLKVAGNTIPAAKRAALKHAAMHHGHSGSWDDLLADEAKARAVLADLSGGTAPPAVPSGQVPEPAPLTAPPDTPVATLKQADAKRYTAENKWCQAAMGRVGHADKDEREAQRDGLAWAVSGGRVTSWAELTRREFARLRDLLAAVDDGRARIVETDDPAFLGWTVVYEREDVPA